LKIVFVSEDTEGESTIKDELDRAGFELILKRVRTEADIIETLDNDQWSLVIVDSLVENVPALRVISLLKARRQEIPYIILFGALDTLTAIEILEASGNRQYVTRSKIQTLGSAILREIDATGRKLRHRLELEEGVVMMMDAWARALELRDHGTGGHTQRVTDMALRLARLCLVPKAMLINIHRGALMHDVGKMGIPDDILLKDGNLTDAEQKVMRTHPTLAYNFLSPITILKDAINIPYCHHEKWDGSGYPRGLKGEGIPIEARIFSVVDVYDALTSDRPYRDAWEKGRALEHIRAERGASFDPDIALMFIDMMEAP
jgi:HD-GYP domain-containing protein (c-di-GMP phosphodiesterase class II)